MICKYIYICLTNGNNACVWEINIYVSAQRRHALSSDRVFLILILTMGRDRPRYRYVGNSLIILSMQNKTIQYKNVMSMQWLLRCMRWYLLMVSYTSQQSSVNHCDVLPLRASSGGEVRCLAQAYVKKGMKREKINADIAEKIVEFYTPCTCSPQARQKEEAMPRGNLH